MTLAGLKENLSLNKVRKANSDPQGPREPYYI